VTMETWECGCGATVSSPSCGRCGNFRPDLDSMFEQLMQFNGVATGAPRRYPARGVELTAAGWLGYFSRAAELAFAWQWPLRHRPLLHQAAEHLANLLALGTSVWSQLPADDVLSRIGRADLGELFVHDEELAVSVMLISDLRDHMVSQGFEDASPVTRTEVLMVEFVLRNLLDVAAAADTPPLPEPPVSRFPEMLAALIACDRYLSDPATAAALPVERRVVAEAELAGTFLSAASAAQLFPTFPHRRGFHD
jgi:hypothetical protein